MAEPPATTHQFSSLLQYDCEAKEMEAKKRAPAIATLCMLLILTLPKPSQEQSHGGPLSDVDCGCYRQCYSGCKDSTPSWLCKVNCACGCPLRGPGHTFDIIIVCLTACDTDSICDLPVPLPGIQGEGLARISACQNHCFGEMGAK